MQRGLPGEQTHPEVAAIPIISAEEITSPTSEPGSEYGFGLNVLNPATRPSNCGVPAPSHRGRARASGSAVTNPSHPDPQANLDNRKVRFSSPLAPDPEDNMPDNHPVILVPNSSDPNLASRVSPNPSNHVRQSSPSPPPFPSPHLLFTKSHPRSLARTLGYRASVADSDVEGEPREADAFVPPITVSTQPRTAGVNGDVASGGSRLKDGKSLKGREEAENVDQPGVDSPLCSQVPAETPRGNVQDCIEAQGAHPHSINNLWEPDARKNDGVRQSPVASLPADVPDRIENSKPMEHLKSYSDGLANNPFRVESEARSKLQAEVEGYEEGSEVIGTSKEVTDPSGPPHSTPFPPLGRMLSLLDGTGPSRSVDGFGRAITRRPRWPIRGRRFNVFQTQPSAEVESGWQSEGTSNVDARPRVGASKSDDLSFFAGL